MEDIAETQGLWARRCVGDYLFVLNRSQSHSRTHLLLLSLAMEAKPRLKGVPWSAYCINLQVLYPHTIYQRSPDHNLLPLSQLISQTSSSFVLLSTLDRSQQEERLASAVPRAALRSSPSPRLTFLIEESLFIHLTNHPLCLSAVPQINQPSSPKLRSSCKYRE